MHDVLGRGDTAFALVMAAVGVGSAAAFWLPGREAAARRRGDGPMGEHLRFHHWAERSLLAGGVMLAA